MPIIQEGDGVEITGKVRTDFACRHLLAAREAALRVHRVEVANAGAEFGPFFEEMINDTVTAVVLSVAALEAYLGEVQFDRARNFSTVPDSVAQALFKRVERDPILDRVNALVALNGKPKTDFGRGHGQSMTALIALRNALVHYTPDWLHGGAHALLNVQIKQHVGINPFVSATETLFPNRWVSYKSAKWAVVTVREFVIELANANGWTCWYQQHAARLALP